MSNKPLDEEALFHAARKIPTGEARDLFLDQACAGDSALAERVRVLLDMYEQEPASEAQTAAQMPTSAQIPAQMPTDRPSVAERAGSLIGPYRLREMIGEGGFGQVFVAEQSEPVRRKVALKLIKPGMDTNEVIARFAAERQALALMDHPNIARVLDAGATESGRPYFVMELVRGIPITEYCDQNQLSPNDRLELFVTVCQAAQHAHQKGIIHRDIKPSNVLVTSHDGKPMAKVIDFGVAKAIHQQLTDRSIYTHYAQMIGTPLYMSPEQAEMSGLDIDTRSDIYSLGVLLYELLTGTTPLEKKRFKEAAYDEVRRLIREEEPQKPSTRLSSSDSIASVAAQRHSEPAKLSKLVRGDLDWITMKALEKDRLRRYETASGFAADVMRYLSGEPVLAAPPSTAYRLTKFVRRHRGRVIAASVVFLGLLIGVVVATIGLFEAKRQQRVAEAARQDEERERNYAEAVAQFVKDDFLGLTSVEGQGRFGGEFGSEGLDRNATLMTLLDRAASKLSARKDLAAPIEAELSWIIGVSYRGAGEAAKAIPFLERSHDLRRSTLGPEHADTLEAANSLGVAYSKAGKSQQGLELLLRIREPYVRTLGADHEDTLGMLRNLATAYHELGKFREAIELEQKVLDTCREAFGPEHEATIATLRNLAVSYKEMGRVPKAIQLLEQVRDIELEKVGAEHINTLITVGNLALAYQKTGKAEEAVELLEQTRQSMAKILQPEHAYSLIAAVNLALAYQNVGRHSDALELLEPLRDVVITELGPDHPTTLAALNNLATLYTKLGRKPQAIEILEQVLEVRHNKLGDDHPSTTASMNNLALAYKEVGQFDKAISLFKKALKSDKARFGDDYATIITGQVNLGAAYRVAGRLEEARSLWEETLNVARLKLSPGHSLTLELMVHLADLNWRSKRLDLSIPLFEELLELSEKVNGKQHVETVRATANLGLNYKDAGRLKEALPLLERAFAAAELHPEFISIGSHFAEALRLSGQADKRLSILEKTLALHKAEFGPEHLRTLSLMSILGTAYFSEGRLDKAVPHFEETLKLFEKVVGKEHVDTLMATINLGASYKEAGRLKAALPLLERAFAATDRHPEFFEVGFHFSEALRQSGQADKGLSILEKTLAIQKKELGPEHPQVLNTMNILGTAYWSEGRLDKAVPHFEKTLKLFEKHNGRQSYQTLNVVANLGVNYRDAGRLAEAISLLEEVSEASKKFPALDTFRGDLLATYVAAGKTAEAQKLMNQLLGQVRREMPSDSPALASVLAQFSLMLLKLQAFPEAEAYLRECLTIREAKDPENWVTINTRSMLGGSLLGQKKYADAELLLLKGYEGMKQREEMIPSAGHQRLTESVQRLVQLYEATDNKAEAAKWKAELDKRRKAKIPK